VPFGVFLSFFSLFVFVDDTPFSFLGKIEDLGNLFYITFFYLGKEGMKVGGLKIELNSTPGGG
jgi:hypothetical protein